MNERIMEKFQEVSQIDTANSVAIENANHFINRHPNFHDELQGDAQGLMDATMKTSTALSNERGRLKEASRWKNENESMLREIVKVATTKGKMLDEASEQNEKMIKMEIQFEMKSRMPMHTSAKIIWII